jgi:hypothetical protein
LIETSFIPRSSELASFIPGGFTNTDRILLVDTKGNVSTSFNGLGPDAVRLVVAAIQSHRKSDRPT